MVSCPGVPRISLAFNKAARDVGKGEDHGICSKEHGLRSGSPGIGGRTLTCSSDWCGLYLGLWILLELWEMADFTKSAISPIPKVIYLAVTLFMKHDPLVSDMDQLRLLLSLISSMEPCEDVSSDW